MGFENRCTFDLHLGHRCNFQCNYCFIPRALTGTSTDDVTPQQLDRYADYIKWMKSQLGSDHEYTMCIFGGEPLLYLDILQPFLRKLRDDLDVVSITTNGSLAKAHWAGLRKLKYALGDKLDVNVSYDFAAQDYTRKAGTYEAIRDGIRWLYYQNVCRKAITVFNGKSLPHIDDVFFDFVKLREELPGLQVKFNLSRTAGEFDTMDEDAIRIALGNVRSYMDEHPELERVFFYNCSMGYQGDRRSEAFYGDVICSMCAGGLIYPGYDLPYMSDFAKKELLIGRIEDDFSELEATRRRLMAKFPIDSPEGCVKCEAVCRVIPWVRMTDRIEQYNAIPDEAHCRVHKLVSEYLPYKA